MSHLLDCSGLLDSGGRASPLGRPHPVSYPVSKIVEYWSRLFDKLYNVRCAVLKGRNSFTIVHVQIILHCIMYATYRVTTFIADRL